MVVWRVAVAWPKVGVSAESMTGWSFFKLKSSDLLSRHAKYQDRSTRGTRFGLWSGRSDLLGNPPGPGFGRSLAVGGASANSNSSSPSEQHLRREALPAGGPSAHSSQWRWFHSQWWCGSHKTHPTYVRAGLTTPRISCDSQLSNQPIRCSVRCQYCSPHPAQEIPWAGYVLVVLKIDHR